MKRKKSNRPNKHSIYILLVILLLLLIALLGTVLFAGYANSEVHTTSVDWAIESPEDYDVYVTINHGNYWTGDDKTMSGTQYDGLIINRAQYELRDWNVILTVPDGSVIDSHWNGNYELDGTKLTYTPDEFNLVVRPNNERSFGFILYAPTEFEAVEITFSYRYFIQPTDYFLFWIFVVLAMIDIMVLVISFVVEVQVQQYSKKHAAYKAVLLESLRTIANIIDAKDEYTKGHSLRVAIYSKQLAERMGMPDYEQERIYYIGLLHDIGKIGIPTNILNKPSRLEPDEYEIIKRHPSLGSTIMKDFVSIKGVQNGIQYHHERFDGKGYNEGLSGKNIPLEGRIICVADSYDAMSSRRCYRDSLTYDFILKELRENSGTQFDPEIVIHMIDMVEGGYAPVSDSEIRNYSI